MSNEITKLTVGWDSCNASVSKTMAEIDVKYTASSGCCCGECYNSCGWEEETTLELDKSDIIAIAKAMKITSKELK